MKVSLYPAAFVAGLIALSVGSVVHAQGTGGTARPTAPAAVPNGTNVAVIDIGFIFKNHNAFNARLKEINSRGEELEAWVKQQQRDLTNMRQKLQTYTAGSPEYAKTEEEITKLIAANDLTLRRQKTDLLNDEAQLYYNTYTQIEQVINAFAQRARIGLVLKYNSEPVKPDDRNSVLQYINRPVVYHHRLDITKEILAELNVTAPAASAQPPAGNATRPQIPRSNGAGGTTKNR